MQNEIEIDDEALIDGMVKSDKMPVRKSKDRRKRSEKNLFAEIKVKMVMRIYGVSRVRAFEIIAERESARKASEKAETNTADGELMDAGAFFGS